MTNWQDDDPIEALRSELKREPVSPDFVARLRQRIEADAETRRPAWSLTWRWLVPAGAVAALIVWLIVPASRHAQNPAPVQTVAQSPTVTPQIPQTPAVPDRTVATDSTAGRPRVAQAAAAIRASAPSATGPVVITDQADVLRAIWASARRGKPRVEVQASVAPDVDPEIVTPKIEVTPLVVKELGMQPIPGVFRIVR